MEKGEISPGATVAEEIIHPIFRLIRRSDGIVQLNTADDAYFTIKEAREFIAALRSITRGVPHPVLKVPGTHANVDKDSRIFMASGEALQYSVAEAVLIRNMAQRIIGNFYLKFDRPKKPVRLFDNMPEAEAWLKGFTR